MDSRGRIDMVAEKGQAAAKSRFGLSYVTKPKAAHRLPPWPNARPLMGRSGLSLGRFGLVPLVGAALLKLVYYKIH